MEVRDEERGNDADDFRAACDPARIIRLVSWLIGVEVYR